MESLKNFLHLRREAERASASLPALVMAADKIASSVFHGDHSQRKTGTGEKFWQFREYSAGDRPQDIDWRQSGKTDEIYIKQKEWQTSQKTYLWCASDKGMDFSSSRRLRTKKENARILTLALALLLTRAEEQVGFFGDNKTGRSERTLQKIGQLLLDDSASNSLPASHIFSLPMSCSFIAVGDFLSSMPDIESCFSNIAANVHNALLVQILDPSELDLNFEGRVLFENTGDGKKEIINHVPSIRAEYQERINSHIAAIKMMCRERSWIHVLHRTDEDLKNTLNLIWMRISTGQVR